MNNTIKFPKEKYLMTQFFYWMIICAVPTFMNAFLTGRSMSPTEIGIVTGFGNIIAVFLQPSISHMADKSKRYNVRDYLLFLSFLGIFMVGGTLLFKDFYLTFIFAMLSITVSQLIFPLINALSFYYKKINVIINYGLSRGIGSISFSITSVILGRLALKNTESPMIFGLFLYIGISILLIFQSFKNVNLINNESFDEKKVEKKNNYISRKNLTLFLIGVAGLYTSYMFLINYIFQIVKNIGGTNKDAGLVLAIASIIEFPAMFAFLKLNKKFKIQSILKFSALMFALKGILTYMATNVEFLFLIQITQAVGFALFTPASVYFMDLAVSPREATKAQGFLSSAITLGSVISAFVGGVSIDLFGPSHAILISTCLALFGSGLIFLSLKNYKLDRN